MTTTDIRITPDPDEPRDTSGNVIDFPARTGASDELTPVADTDPANGATPVDPPTFDGSTWLERVRTQRRQPILPGYLKSADDFCDAVTWVGKHYAHTIGYHVVRLPLYVLRLVGRAPLGAFRLTAAIGRFVSDAEGRPARSTTATGDETQLYLKLSEQRDRRVRTRLTLSGLVAIIAVILVLTLPQSLPTWSLWALVLAGIAVLGKLGTSKDRPVVSSHAVLDVKVQKLTSDSVVRALSVLGIAGINQALAKNAQAIGFTAPITRDGPGWRADVDLPPGVTVTEVIDRRAKLASALGRPLGCVWPDGNAEIHPGRLVLWVGDQDMSKARQPAWPLRKASTGVDLFRPQPFGTDQRGRWVDIVLMFVSMVIGAVPRMGKTFALRVLLLVASMDTRTELHTYDLKGTGDLSPLGQVSHRYRAGDDPDDIEYAVTDLRGLRDEMRRRAKVIRELPKDLCPENKVTPELASKKSLGLHPIVIGVDECQVWFEHPDHGKEIEEICTDLVKRGPALGMILILATQRPDARSIPTSISANAVLRFCLKVSGQVENDMVLGTSAYKNGIRATTLSFRDKGVGYLAGEGDEPRIVRGVNIDAPTAEQLAQRARAARVAAGRLSGYAAGLDLAPEDNDEAVTLLVDVLAAMGDADKAWSATIVDRMADLRPAAYGAWGDLPSTTAKATHLAAALKPYGITTKQVWSTDPETGKSGNQKGIHREWIVNVIAERERETRRS